MGRITSGIGLITGIPIKDTVDQLIAVEAQPRDILKTRTDRLTQQQTAITDVLARVLAVQLSADHLGLESVFAALDVTSSNDDLLTATATGNAAPGTYLFTPVRTAHSHQALSSGFAAATDLVGEGSFSFHYGGAVDKAIDLSVLNEGAGVARGKIRITDRGGKTAEVDLRFARNIDDVVRAINETGTVDVSAEIHGDRIRLVDHSGLAVTNLRVQEAGLGTTAADLGLANINFAASSADGDDVLRLHPGLALSQLNDGHGVRIDATLHDINIFVADGTTVQVDILPGAQKLGDVIDAINAAGANKVRAEIGPDGDRLVLTDLTTGSSVLAVQDANGSRAASDLGLTQDSLGGTVTGRRILGGLNSVLLSIFRGGLGLGSLGVLDIQDRAGNDDSVNLDGAETLQDVVDRINAASVAVEASINDSHSGIVVTDTSGSTAGNLIIRNGNAQSDAADKLGIAINAAVDSVDGGDLGLRLVSENSLLSSLNGGAGVDLGRIRITDSAGGTNTLDLATADVKTVGDVVDAINALAVQVSARINDDGTGVVLVDDAHGTDQIRVEDLSGTSARDLRLLGFGTSVDINGTPTSTINGTSKFVIQFDADDTLTDAIKKINDLGVGLSARLINDGSATTPLRIGFSSERAGAAGNVYYDTTSTSFSVRESVRGRDALVLLGSASDAAAGILVSSSDNSFDELVDGLKININGESLQTVTVNVARTDSSLVPRVEAFVEAYNTLQERLDSYTAVNVETLQTGILFGSFATTRVRTDLKTALGGRFADSGTQRTLEDIGITFAADGRLSLDKTRLQEAFAENPDQIKKLFTSEDLGFADRFHKAAESLVGRERSMLISSAESLARKIQTNNERLEVMNARLERSRERLFLDFTRLETTIAKIRDNLTAISAIQALPPITS